MPPDWGPAESRASTKRWLCAGLDGRRLSRWEEEREHSERRRQFLKESPEVCPKAAKWTRRPDGRNESAAGPRDGPPRAHSMPRGECYAERGPPCGPVSSSSVAVCIPGAQLTPPACGEGGGRGKGCPCPFVSPPQLSWRPPFPAPP